MLGLDLLNLWDDCKVVINLRFFKPGMIKNVFNVFPRLIFLNNSVVYDCNLLSILQKGLLQKIVHLNVSIIKSYNDA